MAKVLEQYFRYVEASDIHEYGYGSVVDFLAPAEVDAAADWVITNPPFRLASEFVTRSLRIARIGVAVLVRTNFIESVGRYQQLFRTNPPTLIVQFAERVPMVKGRLDPQASTATSYCWLVWEIGRCGKTEFVWIPPSRRKLEKSEDYDAYQPTEHAPIKEPEGMVSDCL